MEPPLLGALASPCLLPRDKGEGHVSRRHSYFELVTSPSFYPLSSLPGLPNLLKNPLVTMAPVWKPTSQLELSGDAGGDFSLFECVILLSLLPLQCRTQAWFQRMTWMLLLIPLPLSIKLSQLCFLQEKKKSFPFYLCSTIDSCYLPTSSNWPR